MLLYLLLFWWRRKMSEDSWKRARDREDREINDRAQELLRGAERRQIQRQLNGGRDPAAPARKPARAVKQRHPYARPVESGGGLSPGIIALIVVGGLFAVMLLGCGGLAVGIFVLRHLPSSRPSVAAANPPLPNPPLNQPARNGPAAPGGNNPPNQPVQPVNPPRDDMAFHVPPGAVPASIEFADAPADLPPVQALGRPLAGQTVTLPDGDLPLHSVEMKSPAAICWTLDASGFYVARQDGVVSRVALDGVTEQLRLTTGRTCTGACLSASGLLLTFPAHHEGWLVDADTLRVKWVVRIPKVERILSAPALRKAYAFTTDHSVAIIDLQKRSATGLLAGPALTQPMLTRDGTHLFAGRDHALQRYRVEDDNLIFEEASPGVANSGAEGNVCVSDDGRYASWCWGGGNCGDIREPPLPTYSTLVFNGSALKKPLFSIRQGAYPRLVAFDSKSGKVFAPNMETVFQVFDARGNREKNYKRPQERLGRELQILVHPDGNKVVLLFENRLLVGGWQKP